MCPAGMEGIFYPFRNSLWQTSSNKFKIKNNEIFLEYFDSGALL